MVNSLGYTEDEKASATSYVETMANSECLLIQEEVLVNLDMENTVSIT